MRVGSNPTPADFKGTTMASVNKLNITLGALSGASGSTSAHSLEALTVDHVLAVNVTAFASTTLALSIKTSPDGTNFVEVATLSFTATGLKIVSVPNLCTHIRLDWTLAGGAQTATATASLCYDKRR